MHREFIVVLQSQSFKQDLQTLVAQRSFSLDVKREINKILIKLPMRHKMTSGNAICDWDYFKWFCKAWHRIFVVGNGILLVLFSILKSDNIIMTSPYSSQVLDHFVYCSSWWTGWHMKDGQEEGEFEQIPCSENGWGNVICKEDFPISIFEKRLFSIMDLMKSFRPVVADVHIRKGVLSTSW